MTEHSKTISSYKKSATTVEINGVQCATKSWFYVRYIQETGKVQSSGDLGKGFEGLEIVWKHNRASFYKVDDYPRFKKSADKAIEDRSKAGKASRRGKIDNNYLVLRALEARVSALENVVKTLQTQPASSSVKEAVFKPRSIWG